MKVQSAFFTALLLLAVASGTTSLSCSSGTTDDPTGKGGSGSGSGGSGGSCPNGTACGGNVVGSWTVSSSCLTLGGTLDISLAGLDPRSCSNVKISGPMSVTGTWTANADGTYTDGTTTSGTVHVDLPAGCLMISGTTTTCDGVSGPLSGVGFDSVSCVSASGGGCSCTATIQHTGGIGWLTADPQKSGNYATAGNTLTADGAATYGYCVSGSSMTWSPQNAMAPTSGTIVFQKGSSTGAAGTTGTAGSTGAAGTTGTAGSTGVAGTTGTAGSTGVAGTTGTAGATGTAGSGSAGRGGAAGGTAGGAAGRGGSTGTAGSPGTGGSGPTTLSDGPCDIYAAANTPCVAAYSMIRALTKTYSGPLYQVRNMSSSMNTGSGGMLKDIGMTADGFADTATQDSFCAGTTCTVSLLYDQSGKKNNLKVAPKGLSNGGTYAAMDDFESSATKGALMVGGHKVYSLYMAAREGYRLTAKGNGMPLGNSSQGIYMLADGTHYGTACCWDFGNVSTDPTKYGVMNTLFFGTGFWGKGAGAGPWFLGDFEGGVWAGGSGGSNVTNNSNPSMKVQFAFGILKTSPGKYALRMGDLKTASDLTTAYDGTSPKTWANEGGILLGIGGDNSNNSWGTFYEGAITAGLPSNDTDLAVFKNVKAVGYGN
jgi:hypothetical protein